MLLTKLYNDNDGTTLADAALTTVHVQLVKNIQNDNLAKTRNNGSDNKKLITPESEEKLHQ